MKRALGLMLLLIYLVLIVGCFGSVIGIAMAEDDSPIVEAQEGESEDENITKEDAEKIIIDTMEKLLGQYLENSMVAKIITWIIDAGVLTALVAVYIRYRRVKNKTIEDVIKEAHDQLKDAAAGKFSDEMDPKIKEIAETVADLTKKLNATLQAFALSQDKTVNGKIAMLNLISKASEADEETQEILNDIKDDIIEEAAAVEEVTDKVAEEYQEVQIF